MIAKTGDVRIWHWAHLAENPACGAAGETSWHLEWKALGAPGSQERTVGRRRADVLAPGGFAVEFQRSPLTGTEVAARETDWDHKLVWVFDAADAYAEERLTLRRHPDREPRDPYRHIEWAHAPERVRAAGCVSLLDLGGGRLIVVGRWHGTGPLRGYGWLVSREWAVARVLTGTSVPRPPKVLLPHEAEAEAAARAAAASVAEADAVLGALNHPDPGAVAVARQFAERTAAAGFRPLVYSPGWNGDPGERDYRRCPLCGREHARCEFTAGSLFCVVDDCANPHHRKPPGARRPLIPAGNAGQ
jgi:hypothetical protein